MSKATLVVFASLVFTVSMFGTASQANAQYRDYGRDSFRSATTRRPTVSPYLRLLEGGGSLFSTPYQSLVRPEIEQRQFNLQQSRQISQLRQQVNTSLLQNSRNAIGGLRATGHTTFYMNYSHFYPVAPRR